MIRVYLFAVLLLVTSGYALWRGGAPERIVGTGLVTAYIATVFNWTAFPLRFYGVELNVFAVDVALLVVLLAVAVRADRGWPFLVAALQLDAVGSHVVKLIAPDTIRVAYAVMISVWSWPVQMILAAGTWRHVRRLRRSGYDRSWSLPD